MSNLFTEEKYNVLYQAFEGCAKDQDRFIDEWYTKKMVKEIVDKLEELGYIIVKK